MIFSYSWIEMIPLANVIALLGGCGVGLVGQPDVYSPSWNRLSLGHGQLFFGDGLRRQRPSLIRGKQDSGRSCKARFGQTKRPDRGTQGKKLEIERMMEADSSLRQHRVRPEIEGKLDDDIFSTSINSKGISMRRCLIGSEP